MLKRIVFVSVLLLTVIIPFAQVSMQTGSAVFSLPMFNWQDDKSRLKSIVALSYTSGNGLSVNDVASNVGQGWNLAAGGVVSRMQVGEPDDQQARDAGNSQDISRYPAGRLYATVPVSYGCPIGLTRYPIYGAMNQQYVQRNLLAEDKQVDYFSFQFNGKTGLFVLGGLNGGGGTGWSLGDTKMKITYQTDPSMISQGIRTTITSFTIQDVDGLIYKFMYHGLTKVLHLDYCDDGLVQPQAQPKFDNNGVYHQTGFENAGLSNPYIIGSWYLSEIDDPFTGRKITFGYIQRTLNNPAGADISYTQDGAYTSNTGTGYSIISHKKSISITQDLSSITYPDGHVVTFNYGIPRLDFAGEAALTSVDITYNGRYVSSYRLKTTYFILNRYGTPLTSYQKNISRLCLRQVTKLGVDRKEDSPPYIFDYFLGSNNPDDFVPPPFFYAKDIWGYYNGSNSVGYDGAAIPLNTTVSSLDNNQLRGLCFLRQGISGVYLNAKDKYARNGLLRQIIYPTGGTLSYEYEQNTGVLNGITSMVGGVHVSKTSSTDGGHSNGCANPIVTQYSYVMNGPGSASSLWGLEMPANSTVLNSHYAPEWRSWHWRLSCAPFGCCYWHFMYPGILSQLQAISLSTLQNFMVAAAPVLGILTVISDIVDVVNVCLGSTGFLAWAAVVVDFIAGVYTLISTCTQDLSKDNMYSIFYNKNLNGAAPLPTQFKRVEIVEGSGTIGKSVQEFTSDADYALWVPAGANPRFSAKQRFASWAYGLPKSLSEYDVNGNLIKQLTYSYNYFARNCSPSTPSSSSIVQSTTSTASPNASTCPFMAQVPLKLQSYNCQVTRSSSQRNTDWETDGQYFDSTKYTRSGNGDMAVDGYDLYTGRIELESTYEKIYSTTNHSQYMGISTGYLYNAKNYQVKYISKTQSNGSTIKQIYYPGDYVTASTPTANLSLNLLYQNNVLNEPVAIEEFVNGGASGEKVTEYGLLGNGDVRPVRMMEQRFARPATNYVSYSPDNVNNPTIYHVTQESNYDGNGNLVGLRDEGGRSIANIYDYNDKYIVASVINADPLIDRPAYTSFETSALGNWIIGGANATTNAVPAVTGTMTFILLSQGGNSISANVVNNSRPYTLSFWASNGNVSVSAGATLTKSAPTINGYTYFEYSIAQGTANVILNNNASSNVNIDELRLYPVMARMRSISYDPLIGKTADCDENNRITYYEYDNLGRLRFLKDDHRNILKMYEYNNVSAAKQNGCPGTYSNLLVTELFTKSCPAGYVGTDVPYTVPAGRYTSAISQEDADALAQADLLANGPTAANGGSCRLIYYNQATSTISFTQNCGDGMIGGAVTYAVPQGKYSSLISQQDADQKAQADLYANAQAYANSIDHAVCSVDTDPDWSAEFGGATMCQNVNGSPHTFLQATDINPHSYSYGQTSWQDTGPSPTACPVPTVVYARLSFENIYYLMDGTGRGDLVVRFYSDPGGTIPVAANVTVTYTYSDDCILSAGGGSGTAVAANYKVLDYNVTFEHPGPDCGPFVDCPLCFVNYYLNEGNGYVIIY